MEFRNENTKVEMSKMIDGKGALNERVFTSTLQAAIKGRVITPEDAEYDRARTPFYGRMDYHPAMIVRPTSTSDIAQIILHARASGMELAVRSGGHSLAGHSFTNNGIIIDLSSMKVLDVDPESRSAWAEAGLTAGEYTSVVNEFGLATGFGDTGTVGIGGITLGGGVGYLVRKYGMTIDNLLAAEIVTADGKILHIDNDTHPDLFWAIRGGGGNFGVVTRFQYRLQDVSSVMGGMLILPATADTVANFVNEATSAPEELSSIINIMPAPPMPFLSPAIHGKMIIFGLMTYVGDLNKGQQVFDRFRAIAPPLADMIRPIRYAEMFMPEEEGYHPTAVVHNMHLNRVDRAAAQTMIEYLEASDAPMRAAQIRPLGGAMARVPVDATAYAHRLAPIMANLVSFFTDPEDHSRRGKWLKEFSLAMDQGVPGVYSNFMDDEGPSRLYEAYPKKTWDRLVQIKAVYDPSNLFHRNHNVPPVDPREG